MNWEAIGAVGEVFGALGVKVIENFHHGDPIRCIAACQPRILSSSQSLNVLVPT